MNITKPRFIEKVWGGRSLGKLYNKSLPKGKKIGESWEIWGKKGKVPLVIKLLDVKKPLSIQVHPPGKNGKNELWYILKANSKTRVVSGLKHGITKKDIVFAKLPELLNKYRTKAGDLIYLPGGLIHTIHPPAVLFEVSQNKLITFRLYDWGRKKRKLDTQAGLKALKVALQPRIIRQAESFRCPYFRIKVLSLSNNKTVQNKGYHAYFVLQGKVKVGKTVAKKGQTFTITNKAIIFSIGKTRLVQISC